MKKKLFLLTTLTALVFGVSNLAFGKEFNMLQTTPGMSKKQTATEQKAAKEKRAEEKKEAAQKRKDSKLTAKNSKKTSGKKHKKFLGVF